MASTGPNLVKAKVVSGENVFADSRDSAPKFENTEKSKVRGAVTSDLLMETSLPVSYHSGSDFNS